jgi:hypothetical protein
LLREVWCFIYSWFVKHFGLNSIWVELDIKTPLLNFFASSDHGVELTDRPDAVMGFLKETLTHGCNSFFIFTHFLGDSDEHAEFGWQINILALLLDFE